MLAKAAAQEIEISLLDKVMTINRQADQIKEDNRSRKRLVSKSFAELCELLSKNEDLTAKPEQLTIEAAETL